jgi:hypothetical protein
MLSPASKVAQARTNNWHKVLHATTEMKNKMKSRVIVAATEMKIEMKG